MVGLEIISIPVVCMGEHAVFTYLGIYTKGNGSCEFEREWEGHWTGCMEEKKEGNDGIF